MNFVNATHINRPFCNVQGRGGWLEVTPLPTPTVKGEKGSGKPTRIPDVPGPPGWPREGQAPAALGVWHRTPVRRLSWVQISTLPQYAAYSSAYRTTSPGLSFPICEMVGSQQVYPVGTLIGYSRWWKNEKHLAWKGRALLCQLYRVWHWSVSERLASCKKPQARTPRTPRFRVCISSSTVSCPCSFSYHKAKILEPASAISWLCHLHASTLPLLQGTEWWFAAAPLLLPLWFSRNSFLPVSPQEAHTLSLNAFSRGRGTDFFFFTIWQD